MCTSENNASFYLTTLDIEYYEKRKKLQNNEFGIA